MKVTKQKFYEQLVLETYRRCAFYYDTADKDISAECQQLEAAGYKINEMTFNELHLARNVIGLGEERFPLKQPFDKLGFKYFAQATGFVISSEDEKLVDMYFKVLDNYPELVDFTNDDQANFMYEVFFENLTKNRSFTERLFSVLYKRGTAAKWYPACLMLAYNFSLIGNDIRLDEFLRQRRRFPYPNITKV